MKIKEQKPGAEESPRLKQLVYDIETRPSLSYAWQTWQTNLGDHLQVEPVEMISFAAKWLGQDEVMFWSVHHDGRQEMVRALWRLLDEADVVIGYNSKSFDTPHCRREILLAGLAPPSPFRQVDLYRVVKGQFQFTHNGLDYVCGQLGLGTKTHHDGFDLWLACLRGDPEAWGTMREYNRNDVVITEQLYWRLLPWIPNIPSQAVTGDRVCPACGAERLTSHGWAYTNAARYRRLKCRDCGKTIRESKKEPGKPEVSQIAA